MFSITSIDLVNFKSFRGDSHFDFPSEPGLYYLTGSNQVDKRLGSNGAGKSTLLDAIYWCLFGRSLRGLKAGDIITWGEKSGSVRLVLQVGERPLVIERMQSPNSLTLNDAVVDQDGLMKEIGLNAESFTYSVIMPQFGQPFFNLKAAEKLTLFSEIMNLEFWLECSRQAAKTAGELNELLIANAIKLAGVKAHIESVANDIGEFEDRSDKFEAMRASAIKELKKQIADLTVTIKGLTGRKIKIDKGITAIDEQVKLLKSNLPVLEAKKLSIETRREHHYYKSAEHKTIVAGITKTLEQFGRLRNECPTCKQNVDKDHIEQHKAELKTQLKDEESLFAEATAKFKGLAKQVGEIIAEIIKTNSSIQGEAAERHSFEKDLTNVRIDLEGYSSRLARAEADLAAKEVETNPYEAMIKERQKKHIALHGDLKKLKTERASLQAEHTSTDYWVAGFKRVRLFIIEETLRSLEIEVNNSLTTLGLADWRVEFDVERENKSGGVTKGFTVLIKCPSNPEPVKWEAWSGGETQRLQLAGDFGLANLIMQQAGLSNTIEFYDEPSNHLSDEGLTDLAETLQQRAVNDGKVIMLIDHRTIDFGEFADTIKVVKTKEGSSICG